MLVQTSPSIQGKNIVEPLNLNLATKYCETPMDLAIEHGQISAVDFMLAFNHN